MVSLRIRPIIIIVILVMLLISLPIYATDSKLSWGAMFRFLNPAKASAHVDNVNWKTLGATPSAKQEFTPQGLELVNGQFIFSESWDDKKNVIHIYNQSDLGGRVESTFLMPQEAVHTSGLTWDGEHLWAVDYVSNTLYKIDLDASIRTGNAVVLGEVKTGLTGTGSLAFFLYKGIKSLAICDFLSTKTTYIVPLEKALQDEPLKTKSIGKYKNGYFCQGMESDGTYLYETNNNAGADTIYVIDAEKAVQGGRFEAGLIGSFNAPATMVEDIVIQNGSIWTSDESTFMFYQAVIPPFN